MDDQARPKVQFFFFFLPKFVINPKAATNQGDNDLKCKMARICLQVEVIVFLMLIILILISHNSNLNISRD